MTADFHDITSGNNGFRAVAGYDLDSGWGSPNGANLINALAATSPTPNFTISASPTLGLSGTGQQGHINDHTAVSGGFDAAVVLIRDRPADRGDRELQSLVHRCAGLRHVYHDNDSSLDDRDRHVHDHCNRHRRRRDANDHCLSDRYSASDAELHALRLTDERQRHAQFPYDEHDHDSSHGRLRQRRDSVGNRHGIGRDRIVQHEPGNEHERSDVDRQ